MKINYKITNKIDFRAIIRELAILSELMGADWVKYSTHYKLAKKWVSALNTGIVEIDTDYLSELLEEDHQICDFAGIILLRDKFPYICSISGLCCNKIRYWDIDPENPDSIERN